MRTVLAWSYFCKPAVYEIVKVPEVEKRDGGKEKKVCMSVCMHAHTCADAHELGELEGKRENGDAMSYLFNPFTLYILALCCKC